MRQEEIAKIKKQYQSGMKIKLLEKLDDKYSSLDVDDIGIVDFVDDIGTIHMKWENGSTLGLIPNKDKFELVEKIKVIIAEVNKEPYVKEIYNTLRDKQEIVGGLIDCIPSAFSSESAFDFIINDEGKILELPLNRYIFDKQDVIAGNFIIAKVDNSIGEFISIEDNEVEFLINKLEEKCPKFDIQEYLKNQIEQEEIEK